MSEYQYPPGSQFFGERWDAPVVDYATQVDTPVGWACLTCREPIADVDRGFLRAVMDTDGHGGWISTPAAVHAECELLGTVGHLFGVCHCTGHDTTTRAAGRVLWQRIGELRGRALADRDEHLCHRQEES